MRRLLLLALVGCLLGGCVAGNTYRFDLGDAAFDFESDKTVAVTVVDLRPYVISGEKTPNFVGLMRGGFGNPFDVLTDSGNPLADDMTTSIVKSLEGSGIDAVAVTVPPKSSTSAARERLLAADADRYALLLVAAWKSDSLVRTALGYDLTLEVLQPDGSVTARKELKGRDALDSGLVPADHRVHTEMAFRQKLEELFSDAAVVAALK